MNPMRRENLHSNVEVVMLLTLCTNFQVFAHFTIFADEVVLLIFALQTFSWNYAPIHFVCSPLSSLETFRNICATLCCKRNTARHRAYSLVLQIGNFPYSLKKSVSCVKLFSLKNLTLSLSEAQKAHWFCFLLFIQSSGAQQKLN